VGPSTAWTLEEPLTRVSFFRDWDYCTSAFGALRYYWLSHGTIPHWNLAMCGGKPELANPASLALTWPSLFAYVLPPIWALLALASLLTVVGLVGMWLLLRRFGATPAASTVGALLYGINGYYASHFNQGHITFVLFHLVPVMILLFDHCLEQRERGERRLCSFLAVVGVSAMFFSAAIPHPIFHFYPVFAFYVIIRCCSLARRFPWRRALRLAAIPCLAHLLGLWLAAYKLGPIVLWQLTTPRVGVVDEMITLRELWWTFFRFAADYYEPKAMFSHQYWGYWEYNAYVGPGAVVAALGGLILLVSKWFRSPRNGGDASARLEVGGALALVCVVAGPLLTLGNDHIASPAQVFRHLPLFSGIRVFGRYHAITLFGLAVLNAFALTWLLGSERYRRLGPTMRRLLVAIAFALLCAPPAVQWAYLVWNIKGVTYDFLTRNIYTRLPPQAKDANPVMIRPWRQGYEYTTQTYLLDHGYFSAECYEPLSGRYVDLSGVPVGSIYPMTTAPSSRFADATTNSFSFTFGDIVDERVQINLQLHPEFKASIPGDRTDKGFPVYEAEQLRGKTLTITTTMAADRWSAACSAAGLLFTGAVALLYWRRRSGGVPL
jgi:hypothetical protein